MQASNYSVWSGPVWTDTRHTVGADSHDNKTVTESKTSDPRPSRLWDQIKACIFLSEPYGLHINNMTLVLPIYGVPTILMEICTLRPLKFGHVK